MVVYYILKFNILFQYTIKVFLFNVHNIFIFFTISIFTKNTIGKYWVNII